MQWAEHSTRMFGPHAPSLAPASPVPPGFLSRQPAPSNSWEPVTTVTEPGSFTEIPTGLSCAKFTLTIIGLFIFLNDIDCPITLKKKIVAGSSHYDFPAYVHSVFMLDFSHGI